MRVGSIVDLPDRRSIWATVKDEFHNTYTVAADQLPEDAEEGENVTFEYAYQVNLSQAASMAANVKRR